MEPKLGVVEITEEAAATIIAAFENNTRPETPPAEQRETPCRVDGYCHPEDYDPDDGGPGRSNAILVEEVWRWGNLSLTNQRAYYVRHICDSAWAVDVGPQTHFRQICQYLWWVCRRGEANCPPGAWCADCPHRQ